MRSSSGHPRPTGEAPSRARVRFSLAGQVQGVGLRPEVYRRALRHGVCGFVCNELDGVRVEAEGAPGQLRAFADDLHALAVTLAAHLLEREELTLRGETAFAIVQSSLAAPPRLSLAADVRCAPTAGGSSSPPETGERSIHSSRARVAVRASRSRPVLPSIARARR